jgi:polyhydroxyalkanoate synthesis regulator phasin
MVLARMGDSKVLVPLAAAGLEAERSVRRFWDSALTAVYHLYQLPTRREVLVLAEQVSALRHRVAHLEDAARSNPIRTRSHP